LAATFFTLCIHYKRWPTKSITFFIMHHLLVRTYTECVRIYSYSVWISNWVSVKCLPILWQFYKHDRQYTIAILSQYFNMLILFWKINTYAGILWLLCGQISWSIFIIPLYHSVTYILYFVPSLFSYLFFSMG